LILSEGIVANDGIDPNEILALGEGLERALTDEDGGHLGVFEDVGDVLVAEGVVDGDGGEGEEVGSDVSQRPLRAILGEDAEQSQLLPLRN
jgi:hypothetical protein